MGYDRLSFSSRLYASGVWKTCRQDWILSRDFHHRFCALYNSIFPLRNLIFDYHAYSLPCVPGSVSSDDGWNSNHACDASSSGRKERDGGRDACNSWRGSTRLWSWTWRSNCRVSFMALDFLHQHSNRNHWNPWSTFCDSKGGTPAA